jgi:cytochrome c-type biogenesis protein CcmH/NrfG
MMAAGWVLYAMRRWHQPMPPEPEAAFQAGVLMATPLLVAMLAAPLGLYYLLGQG